MLFPVCLWDSRGFGFARAAPVRMSPGGERGLGRNRPQSPCWVPLDWGFEEMRNDQKGLNMNVI